MSFPLAILCLDFFGVTVALPAIGEDLDASTGGLEWAVNAYLLAFAAPLIALGRLADIVGRRKIVLLGTGLFAAASAVCGLAPTIELLIAARVVQGIGASMLYSTSLSIVSNAFTEEKRGTGIGIWTGVGTIGQTAGPILAGVLTTYLSWRWFFMVNIPLAIAGIVLTLAVVEESKDPDAQRVDRLGFATVTAALVLTTFAFQTASDVGMTSPLAYLPLILGLVVGGAFIGIERRVREPLVDFSLFQSFEYASAAGVAFTANWIFSASMFFLTLYVQFALDYDAFDTGLVFLAFAIPFAAMSPLAGRIIGKWGTAAPMFVGMLIVAASCVPLILTDATSGISLVIVAFLMQAVGQGLAYNISTTAAMNAVPTEKAGLASGAISAIRMIALVFGVAVSGLVFKLFETSEYSDAVQRAGGQLTESDRNEIQGVLSGSSDAVNKLADLAPETADEVERVVREAFTAGLRAAFAFNLLIALVGAGMSLLGRHKKEVTHTPSSSHAIPVAEPKELVGADA